MNTKKTIIVGIAVAIIVITLLTAAGVIKIIDDDGEKYDKTYKYTINANSEFSYTESLPYRSYGPSKIIEEIDVPAWVGISIENGRATISGTATDEPGEYVFVVKYEYNGSISTEHCKTKYIITVV